MITVSSSPLRRDESAGKLELSQEAVDSKVGEEVHLRGQKVRSPSSLTVNEARVGIGIKVEFGSPGQNIRLNTGSSALNVYFVDFFEREKYEDKHEEVGFA
ncbi:hypothetical protein CEXT_338061 [Caerostris extrusa]|uniref:Uncharacterized protein n=1 Tax=Caerostris extrusa TaxID=172846 RepID=A0AAV4Y8F6_CAEEX|nr:hypothetical protein CEXT_338061 [Caerostris extrusa]